MNSKINIKFIIKIIIPLIIGLSIYLFIRPNNLLIYNWLNYNPRFAPKIQLNKNIFFINTINTLPSLIWTYIYINIILFVWNYKINYYSLIFISLSFLFIVLELFQYKKWLSGTYDFKDIVAITIGIILPFLINKTKIMINLK